MKLRAGYLLLAFGLLALIVLTVVRLGRDRLFYELQLREQADSIESGLQSKWKSYLLSAAQKGKVPKDFVLKWDRSGRTLRSPFYPEPGVQLEWAEYREAKHKEDFPLQKAFLTKALNLRRSWDRILAIEEWKRFDEARPGPAPEGFESTMLDPEAKNAYSTIINEFENGRDFTFARTEAQFDQVFFNVTNSGELEGYLPSISSVKETLLEPFQATNNLSEASFGANALDIRFPQFQKIAAKGFGVTDTLLLTASALLLMLGVGLTAGGIREQRKTLSQRVGFLNQVVHELKTPLAGLKLSAQLISRNGPSETNLQAIFTSINRLDRLFDDIVRINRAEQRADSVTLSKENLNELILSLCQSDFKEDVTIMGNATKDVMCEPGRLRVLLRNLISNGVKYGKKVTLKIIEMPGLTEISVQDLGPGVSLTDAPKIFEEFYRAQSARKIEADGLGLGLSLVKKLASELGTEVILANPGEPQALFLLRLPQVKREES